MREYRGKRIDNGEWVYGSLICDPDTKSCTITGFDYYSDSAGLQREPFEYPVDPKTVGQKTGAKYAGEDVWEGDLFEIEGNWPVYTAVFDENIASFGLKSPSGPFYSFAKLIERNEVLVYVGNVNDTELLEP